MERFLIEDILDSNMYITTCYAYDKKKKCKCILEIPNIKTSWEFNVTY